MLRFKVQFPIYMALVTLLAHHSAFAIPEQPELPPLIDDIYLAVGVNKNPAPYCANEITPSEMKRLLNEPDLARLKTGAKIVGSVALVVGCTAFFPACFFGGLGVALTGVGASLLLPADETKTPAFMYAQAQQVCGELYGDRPFNDMRYFSCLQLAYAANEDIAKNHGRHYKVGRDEDPGAETLLTYQGHFPITRTDVITQWKFGNTPIKRVTSFAKAQDQLRALKDQNQYCLADQNILEQLRAQHFTLEQAVELLVSSAQSFDTFDPLVKREGFEINNVREFRQDLLATYSRMPGYEVTEFDNLNNPEKSIGDDIARLRQVIYDQWHLAKNPSCGISDLAIHFPFDRLTHESVNQDVTLSFRWTNGSESRDFSVSLGDVRQRSKGERHRFQTEIRISDDTTLRYTMVENYGLMMFFDKHYAESIALLDNSGKTLSSCRTSVK